MPHRRIVSISGLGYTGLTTCIALSQAGTVIALDVDPERIDELKSSHDRNGEVSNKELSSKNLYFSTNPADLDKADFHIISVPTPLDDNKQPDLSKLLNASKTVGSHLKKGGIVVYESTVYPGVTEEICVPVLEKYSRLKFGDDFTVGYSPERINPSDKTHTFYDIIKIISASDKKTLEIMSNVYGDVIKAGTFSVSSIRVAEACKVIENTQRDVNIAIMNDIAMMLHTLNIDTKEVISAMQTKWNWVAFEPGLVGGHCIGTNSYYLMHIAEKMGYHSELIAASRHVNESLPKFIAHQIIRQLIHLGIKVKSARVALMGFTYKENCTDPRENRSVNILSELEAFGVEILIHDPIADPDVIKQEYGIDLIDWGALYNVDTMVFAIAHDEYTKIAISDLKTKLNKPSLVVDLKSMFNPDNYLNTGIMLWRL